MSTTIKANVSKMFVLFQPALVSGSRMELGESAGRITWSNALAIAQASDSWLLSDKDEAVSGMYDWAVSTGAWDRGELKMWKDVDMLALFAQSIASELRMLGSDDNELEALADIYASTDWEKRSEYPVGHYSIESGNLTVEYYTGV